jgi:hypothetical protein
MNGSAEIDKKELLNTLEQMTSTQFDKLIFLLNVPQNLMPSSDKPQTERAIALLLWAQAPGGCVLERIKQVLEIEIEQKLVINKLPKPCNFDLNLLIENCLEKIIAVDHEQGIIGLAIPCDEDTFLHNFCERLKNELDRSRTDFKEAITLSPKITSVEETIKKIKRYKMLLKIRNIICPVRIQIFNYYPNSANISNTFWQSLAIEFNDGFPYRLIVIMTGSEDSIFPDAAIHPAIYQLEPPQFKPVHVLQWMREIADRLEGAESAKSIIDRWKQLMIAECSDNNLLDIRCVYEHLDESLRILQQNPSAEVFLRQLEQRRQLYA